MNMENNKKGKRNWKWWPHLVIALSILMVGVIFLVVYMAQTFPVPDDAPMEIPMPDDGENVPGPEWVFLLFWVPFWYFKGRLKKWLFITSLVPIVIFAILVLLPFLHKIPFHRIPGLGVLFKKASGMKSGIVKSFLYAAPALVFFAVIIGAMYTNGHQAKSLGCDSCHNPAMGKRMAIPPEDVAWYYNVDRARQIGVGKYRAGKFGVSEGGEHVYASGGETEGYKDANWQLRHMYEPTFTW
ncbi:hypothetical protein MNBD_NITROSPINAE02-1162 [hydrothermal vent metagenome]|uniref:Cytochrome c domain-containing protein n=1 Tax=hydrothermal vent metagenome TaxID=652676 RepID=A0A3B1CN80_9ZZZZ